MALELSGSINISGSMTATTIIVSAPGAPGMVSSSNQLVELNTATGSIKGEIAGIEAYTSSLKGAIEVSGQNVNVLGTLTAQEIYTTYVTSSVMFKSGSTKFGDDIGDRHEFTGSLFTSGSFRARLGTNENLNILSLGSGDMRVSAINDALDTTVQLSIQASPLILRSAGGTEAMRITSGGIGIGVTPNAWNLFSALQLGGNTYSAIASSTNYLNVSTNTFYDGTDWRYITTNSSTRYQQSGGSHQFLTAPLGTEGNAVTYTGAMFITGSRVGIGTSTPTATLDVNGEIRMNGSTLFRGMSSNTLQLCGGTSSSNVKINGASEEITMDTNGTTRVTIASSGTITAGGAINTSENLLYSKRTSPSNVNSGATTAFTITQKAGEFQSTYIISIIGLYDSGGSNQNGYYTGIATFFTDSAIAQASISGLHSNGWSATAAATTGGSFTVTFTNAAATTMSNIRINALKINAT